MASDSVKARIAELEATTAQLRVKLDETERRLHAAEGARAQERALPPGAPAGAVRPHDSGALLTGLLEHSAASAEAMRLGMHGPRGAAHATLGSHAADAFDDAVPAVLHPSHLRSDGRLQPWAVADPTGGSRCARGRAQRECRAAPPSHAATPCRDALPRSARPSCALQPAGCKARLGCRLTRACAPRV
jgi:hypothetical protein